MAARTKTLVVERPEQLWRIETRREFLRLLGIGGTIVMLPSVFAACDDDDNGVGPGPGPVSLNFSNDLGILNYAYALEQLEAGFYIAVLASGAFAGLSAEQREVFTDLRNHEVIHREFFRAAIPAASRVTIAGVNVGGLSGLPAGSDVTEAFDQPLNRTQVTAIVQPFFKPPIPAS